MIGQLYGTAESAPGSLAWRVKTTQLEAAREMGRCIGGIVIAAVLLIAIGDAFGVLISNTDSAAAVGVYRVVSGEPKRGDLVAACLPIAIAQQGLACGYLRTGSCPGDAEPVGKIIGALPGDTVRVERGWVSVDGVRFARSAVAERDSAHRPLRHVPWGKYLVGADQVWLFGFNDRRSWDSRYFGPVPLANVRGKLQPIVTW
jgi:conjugative transfer signal peptidase TraF